jgi:MoaA/NifB/PqqE/SkfB family radical SAM enzyme
LLRPPGVARELRRELMAFYPYLSTLRIQGGEVFAIRGFRELIEDVSSLVSRPIVSISTNGTLIDDEWAERMVRTPFSNVTVSIDGATRATYNRLRGGADLDCVLANIDLVQRWKARLGSERPHLDSFFVVMRSNFREIPEYLELMRRHGMVEVALQTMELSRENIARNPALEADESIADRREVEELHAILQAALPRFQNCFRTIRVSGLRTLFEAHGLSPNFLEEDRKSLYPDSEGLAAGAFELCPNPWTTLFLAENGDAHLCFISQPIGNLYADSLSALWNSPQAIAKRAGMIAGRYLASGCSRKHCAWREGKSSPAPDAVGEPPEWRDLVSVQPARQPENLETLALVRGLITAERRRSAELEVYNRRLESLLEAGEKHIGHLEAKAEKAVADFRDLEAEFVNYRTPKLVRAARRLGKALGSLSRR